MVDSRLYGVGFAMNGILLLMANPTGQASAAYSPSSLGSVIFKDSGVVTLTSQSNSDLDADGYWSDSASFPSFANWISLPAYTTRRKYEVWGKTKNAALTAYRGVGFVINRQDGSNLWGANLQWDGSAFYVEIFDAIAGVFTTRGLAFCATTIDEPAVFHFVLYEQGDSLVAQATLYEADAITDAQTISCAYTVGSRPFKTETRGYLSQTNSAADEWLIRGCRISDMN
jgi:hypothetical protein